VVSKEAGSTELVRGLRATLAGVPEVAFAYLFGSRARGDARADSDVDLAVMLTSCAVSMDGAARIRYLAPKLLPVTGDALDLVFLDRAGILLAHRVLRDGILVRDADPVARVRHQVATVSRYLDTSHLRWVQIEATRRNLQARRHDGRPRDPRAALARLG
jgi:predicted nucleotidyltransferase